MPTLGERSDEAVRRIFLAGFDSGLERAGIASEQHGRHEKAFLKTHASLIDDMCRRERARLVQDLLKLQIEAADELTQGELF